ncbi:MAG: hypothetical protein JWO57_2973, partial [Pseudonocardiales bacterium]|nr:hypothetical protein [Pseudonocardiales bacterium]
MTRASVRTAVRRTVVVVAAIAVLAGIGYAALYRPARHPLAVPPATPPATAPSRPAPAPAPEPAPVAAVRRPVVPHQVVASAAPTTFEIKGSAFDIKATVCQMPYIRPLDPPGDQMHTVCWVRDSFGVAPGSKAQGTSYILGHAWAEAPLVFNPMSEFAMRQVDQLRPRTEHGVPIFPVTNLNGYQIVLHTPHGVLTYRVTRAFAVAKARAGDVPSLMANTPNRVVLITCGVKNGVDVDVNVVVYA